MSGGTWIRLLLSAGFALVGTACGPTAPKSPEEHVIVPPAPQVTDEGLRQQLNTLRAMVSEYAKLSGPGAPNDEKTASRLDLLKQGFAEFRRKCAENLDKAGADRKAVEDFLDRCGALMQEA